MCGRTNRPQYETVRPSPGAEKPKPVRTFSRGWGRDNRYDNFKFRRSRSGLRLLSSRRTDDLPVSTGPTYFFKVLFIIIIITMSIVVVAKLQEITLAQADVVGPSFHFSFLSIYAVEDSQPRMNAGAANLHHACSDLQLSLI